MNAGFEQANQSDSDRAGKPAPPGRLNARELVGLVLARDARVTPHLFAWAALQADFPGELFSELLHEKPRSFHMETVTILLNNQNHALPRARLTWETRVRQGGLVQKVGAYDQKRGRYAQRLPDYAHVESEKIVAGLRLGEHPTLATLALSYPWFTPQTFAGLWGQVCPLCVGTPPEFPEFPSEVWESELMVRVAFTDALRHAENPGGMVDDAQLRTFLTLLIQRVTARQTVSGGWYSTVHAELLLASIRHTPVTVVHALHRLRAEESTWWEFLHRNDYTITESLRFNPNCPTPVKVVAYLTERRVKV